MEKELEFGLELGNKIIIAKSFKYQDRYLLIKYEDLIHNTEIIFLKY